MSEAQEGARYNLKAVVQQTGLKPDTLRAWERRYGLPSPNRSGGKHRLYSLHDIHILHWLVARQREGLSISRAVDLWKQHLADGRGPLDASAAVAPPPAVAPQYLGGGAMAHLRGEWLAACLAYDEEAAEQVLAQAFALYPPEVVCFELLQAALAKIGEGWYRGEIMVQQEHFASALAVRRLEALLMAAPHPTRPGRIVAACPAHEHHVFGLLLITFLLRRQGWGVVYLGADVPAEHLESLVAEVRPQLVVLAAQQLHTAASLLDSAVSLAEQHIPTAYGGLIFNRLPEIRERIPAHFLGEELATAMRTLEALVGAPRPAPPARPLPVGYARALEHLSERQGLIEADVLNAAREMGIAPAHAALAGRALAANIGAALRLGGMDLLGFDLGWVQGLLAHHRVPQGQLRAYLEAYARAAGAHLDQRGEPVVLWLSSALALPDSGVEVGR